jgi:myo-inositol-1(or 4)-monophosphatase
VNQTVDFLHEAENHIRATLERLRPKLLEAQGTIEHHLKNDETVVTEMDTFVEEELQKTLEKLDPGIAFGGEEGGVDFNKSTFWLVDPIDGTEAFIRGLPFATNMVTLIDNNEPVFGAIYNFTMGDFYVAIKGHGAMVNGHPIHVSNRPADKAWIALGAIAGKPGTAGLTDHLSEQVVSRVRRFGAAGFDYHLIASGALDGCIRYQAHGHEWDFAPGTLLVQEAGGRVANIGSNLYDYRKFDHIAANPVIFDALMEFMTEVERNAKNIAD